MAKAPSYDIEFYVSQNYDHYHDRYRQIFTVVSWVYEEGNGYPTETTHCNEASYSSYNVTLKKMKPGDRFRLWVIWDDGTFKKFDETLSSSPSQVYYVDEPDAFSQFDISGWQ